MTEKGIVLLVALAMVSLIQAHRSHGHEKKEKMNCGNCGLSNPRLVKSFTDGTPVYGVASVGRFVYVVRENSSQVQQYDTSNNRFESAEPLDILKKQGFYDMVHLPHSNSLALLNWFDPKEVFVVSLQSPYVAKTFTFTSDSTTAALAVGTTTDGNDDTIIITESNKYVKEYSPDGNMLLKFELQISETPRQTIRLEKDIYATTFGYNRDEGHYVCRFNNKGEVIGKCFGGQPGNSVNQLDVPARMVLTPDKKAILLADMKNKRIMKLSHDLSVAEVLLDANNGIRQPYRLHLDDKKCLLYVADNELNSEGWSIAGRVLAFKL